MPMHWHHKLLTYQNTKGMITSESQIMPIWNLVRPRKGRWWITFLLQTLNPYGVFSDGILQYLCHLVSHIFTTILYCNTDAIRHQTFLTSRKGKRYNSIGVADNCLYETLYDPERVDTDSFYFFTNVESLRDFITILFCCSDA